MATRYTVASGNWNSTSVWSTTSGGAPGASVPGINDTAVIEGSRTVTLTTDQSVDRVEQSTGTLNISSYTLNICSYLATGTGAKTLNLGTGVLLFDRDSASFSEGFLQLNPLTISGSGIVQIDFKPGEITNATVRNISTIPTLVVNDYSTNAGTLNIGSITPSRYDTVIINKISTSGIRTVSIGGGFSSNTSIEVRRLVINGQPSVLRLGEASPTYTRTITMLGSNQLVAANSIIIRDVTINGIGSYYAGSTSTDSGGNVGWIFNDAPILESFEDAFTGGTVDSSKWATSTSSGGAVSQSSGVLTLSGSSSSSSALLRSVNQYVLEGSSVRFKLSRALGGLGVGTFTLASAIIQYGISARRNIPNISFTFGQTSGNITIQGNSSVTDPYTFIADDVYLRFREESGVLYFDGSPDGIVYTNRDSWTLSTYGIESSQLLARPSFSYDASSGGSYSIDDFNIDLAPTAEFTGTPTTITRGQSVTFTDQSNFSPTSWSWNFGDSTTSTVQNPVKTYSLPGLYTVALTASNSLDSESITKNDYITVQTMTFTQSIEGTFVFGGDIDSETVFNRSFNGTFLLGGGVVAIVDSDSGRIERKTYMYKVYDEDNNFISVIDDVLTDPTWSEEINRTGSTVKLELGRNSDSLVVGIEPLLDSDGDNIEDSNNLPILTTTESRNKVGAGSNIAHNYRVDIFVFYGSVSPIQDSDELDILDSNNEPILGTEGAPNGVRRFTGFISEINIGYGESETTEILLMSYGYDLDQYLIKSGSNTTVTYSSQDPSAIVRSGLDSLAAQGAPDIFTTYNTGSIQDTGTTTTLTFRANTIAEVIQKSLEASPSGWFYYVDLGNNLVNFRERSAQPDHTFLLGKHIKSLDLRSYIGDVVNEVLFTGGGDPASPFKLYTRSVGANTRRGLNRISDARVTVTATADAISNAELDTKETVQYRSTVTILSEVFDIESINVGDTVQFRNFDNFVDDLMFQIVAKTYTPDFVTLQLDTLPRNINRVIDSITRQLEVEQNVNVPAAPTT